MKYVILIFSFILLLTNNALSQDIIVQTNGDEIEVKVIEITSETIKYRLFENLDGPLRNINISNVFMIIYENGSRETFTSQQQSISQRQKNDSNYQNYLGIGLGYGNSFGGLGANFSLMAGDSFKWGFHAGAGYFPSGDVFLASLGFKFYLVEGLYLNPQFGSFGVESYYGWYDDEEELLYGPSLLIGYELNLSERIALIGSFGGSYAVDTKFFYALDSGFIIKF
jgi:hypothetical protein